MNRLIFSATLVALMAGVSHAETRGDSVMVMATLDGDTFEIQSMGVEVSKGVGEGRINAEVHVTEADATLGLQYINNAEHK